METFNIKGVGYALEIHQHDSALPYLLMLHGFMGDGRVFHHLIKDLCAACNPVTVDLLGHGQSEKIYDANRYREEQQIEDIIEIVQQIGRPPLFLYGYSMGGRLVLKTARKAPGLFKGLILESTTFGILDDDERTKRRETDARRAQKIKEDYESFLSKWEELALFQSPVAVDGELATQYRKIHLEQDPETMAASLTGFGTGSMEPVRNRFHNFDKPVMIIAGTGDQKYMGISRSLVSCFDNTYLCHIKAGHRIHLDNPEELTKEITLFIDQNAYI